MLLGDVRIIDDDGSTDTLCIHTTAKNSLVYQWNSILSYFDNIDSYILFIRYCYKSSNSVPSHDLSKHVSADMIDQLKNNPKVHLIIYSIEHITAMVDDIYKFLADYDISHSKVILICELPTIDKKVKKIAQAYNLGEISCYFLSMNEFDIHKQLRRLYPTYSKLSVEKKPYSTSFLNFNRKWRLHRFLFVNLLLCNDMLDRGMISLTDVDGEECDRRMLFDQVLNSPLIDIDTKKLFVHNKNEILNLQNLEVDDINLANNIDCIKLQLIESAMLPYRNTYFSAVSETFFFKELETDNTHTDAFITEKTFKTVSHKHPFILIARPGTLSLFKSMGYRSFSPYINESYDDIQDDMERMTAILAEIKRLDELSEDELFEFIDNVSPILEYNFNRLVSKADNQFVTKLPL